MRKSGDSTEYSATDLVGFLQCRHLTQLDRAVIEGRQARPKIWDDPLLEILQQRGANHELAYLEHLKSAGLDTIRIDGEWVTPDTVAATRDAMRRGVSVIAQAALSHERWIGRADVLRRVQRPSALGDWSYEPVDTKLARETKAATVLQLCLYADLLKHAQNLEPEYTYAVVPWSDFEPVPFRFTDYAAYFRKVKRAFLATMNGAKEETYPEPVEHCDVCRWQEGCDKRRRDDDHLCLVAGISKVQINELKQRDVTTVKSLAEVPLPLPWKPDRGASDSYIRIREQARIVVEAREADAIKFELLGIEPGFGLTRLPEPSGGDVFLDLEGDPFVGEHGLEYLFGYCFPDAEGTLHYVGDWSLDREEEKHAFETFVDFAGRRWGQHKGMHIFHYAPYEPGALKRLMGRYATREEEIDQMLRAGLFVDLYQVVRRGLRASVESYSIKKMEPFYRFEREMPLPEANFALTSFQAYLELGDGRSITEATKNKVRAYNKDDCRSALALRDWLEALRSGLIEQGKDVPRPVPGDGAANEKITARMLKVKELGAKLTADIPADPDQRTPDQKARWVLANVLDWHRREDKAVWWEYFRLRDLAADDLLEERAGLAGLAFVEAVGGTARAPIHRYRFPAQETEIRGGEKLHSMGGADFGEVVEISFDHRTVDIKKRGDTADVHPQAVFAHNRVKTDVIADALIRIGEHVADHGIVGNGPYQAARDLLLRCAPRVGGQPLRQAGETPVQSAIRLCGALAPGVLPIQGPPGSGKTYTGAQMICELVRLGKTVGVTANSHKVIRHLVKGVIKTADENGIDLHCCLKADETEEPQHRLSFAKNNAALYAALRADSDVGGGTAWLWSHPDVFEMLDVLFVDEAAQMSLANVLAVSQAAKTLVLIGDPRQLDQPMKGSHPDGADVSALDHILAGEQTISPDKGLFLEETWRLHPAICAYTSELFYEGRLRSHRGLDRQLVMNGAPIGASGLYYIPVAHSGNRNCSPEEARVVAGLVDAIVGKAKWIDREGIERELALGDILIIAPYNAQVFEIRKLLPGALVGTVDKFQGQEAPIAVYSMATSSHADAPRGMEFLYSLNRLNVATSRAKCASIVVSSPQVFDAECRTPRQIQLANAFCRYLEMTMVV